MTASCIHNDYTLDTDTLVAFSYSVKSTMVKFPPEPFHHEVGFSKFYDSFFDEQAPLREEMGPVGPL
jgi:hypothetical protein